MAFIKEIIQTDEQKAFFDSFGFHNYQGDVLKSRKKLTEWYIDKEKAMYLVEMGGGSFEIPQMYGLLTSQGLILIQSETNGSNMVKKISYSKKITLSIEDIRNDVKRALEALGKEHKFHEFKNLSDLPCPVLMDNFEEEYYVFNN